MKKVSLFILIAISMSAYGFSQDTVRIKYGLFAGANVSQIHTTVPGSGSAYSANKVGLNFGILVEVPFSSYFAIQPELSFSQLGWNVTERLYLDSLTLNNPKYNLNYISLPILIKFKVAPTVKNGNGLALYAGPQVGYLAGANLTADNASGSQSIKDGFGSFDFSGRSRIFYAHGDRNQCEISTGLFQHFQQRSR
jgi:hypothetical protein